MEIDLDTFIPLSPNRMTNGNRLKNEIRISRSAVTISNDVGASFKISPSTAGKARIGVSFKYSPTLQAIALESIKSDGFILSCKENGDAEMAYSTSVPLVMKSMHIPIGKYMKLEGYPNIFQLSSHENSMQQKGQPPSVRFATEETPEIGDIVTWSTRPKKGGPSNKTILITGKVIKLTPEKVSMQVYTKSWLKEHSPSDTAYVKLENLIIREKKQ